MSVLEPWHLVPAGAVVGALSMAGWRAMRSARGRAPHLFRKAPGPAAPAAAQGHERDPARWGESGWPY
jgi:hypothetical protein